MTYRTICPLGEPCLHGYCVFCNRCRPALWFWL
jgi:hypothetical protein